MSIDTFLLSPKEADETLRSILVCPSTQATMLGVAPLDCMVDEVIVLALAAVVAIVFIVPVFVILAVAVVVVVACY
jgi:hypothetical protein